MLSTSPQAVKMRRWRAANPDQARATAKAWRDKNPDKVAAQQARHLEKNPSARRQSCKDWYWRNLEKERARARAKRQANLEKYREHSRGYNAENLPKLAAIARNRRARAAAGGIHTEAEIIEILRSQKSKCAYCRTKLGDKYHVDHIVALANGGGNTRRNLQILCAPCNQEKSRRDPLEFARSKGFLI